MTPPTTTLLPDYPAMAAHALDLIEMFLQRKQPPGDIACPGRLLIRDSVRDLRNQNFTTGSRLGSLLSPMPGPIAMKLSRPNPSLSFTSRLNRKPSRPA